MGEYNSFGPRILELILYLSRLHVSSNKCSAISTLNSMLSARKIKLKKKGSVVLFLPSFDQSILYYIPLTSELYTEYSFSKALLVSSAHMISL